MKSIRHIKFFLLATVLLSLVSTSCRKGWLDVNENPNSPTSVPPKVLLPGAQVSLAYTQGGDISRYTSVFMQQVVGANRQFFSYNKYVMTEEEFNNLWTNLYVGTMKNLDNIEQYAEARPGQYTRYQAISRILMAYTLGLATDLFGDIPYTQAFRGSENLNPAYDSQEEIYNHIQRLLSQGIDSLNDPGTDLQSPSSDDFIYGGNIASWQGFAWALKARFHLHLSNRDPGAYAKALDALNNGGLVSDAAVRAFSASAWNPWFQYIYDRDDITYEDAPFLTEYVGQRNDPRLGAFNDLNGDYWDVGYLGAFYMADDAPVYLMTWAEQKFIEAEARLMTGDQAGAQSAYEEGITASFELLGFDPLDSAVNVYMTDYATLSGSQEEMRCQIIYEKIVANFLHPEAWTDWRRTSTGSGGSVQACVQLNPTAGDAIPRRFIYPTAERLYNQQGVNQGSTLFSPRVWWDVP